MRMLMETTAKAPSLPRAGVVHVKRHHESGIIPRIICETVIAVYCMVVGHVRNHMPEQAPAMAESSREPPSDHQYKTYRNLFVDFVWKLFDLHRVRQYETKSSKQKFSIDKTHKHAPAMAESIREPSSDDRRKSY